MALEGLAVQSRFCRRKFQPLLESPDFLEFDDAEFQMEAFQTRYDPAVGQVVSGLFPELS